MKIYQYNPFLFMNRFICFITLLTFSQVNFAQQANSSDYQLVWADEFNQNGPPNPDYWTFEEGFKRNNEDQWYQKENAYCKDGLLLINLKKRKEEKPNVCRR